MPCVIYVRHKIIADFAICGSSGRASPPVWIRWFADSDGRANYNGVWYLLNGAIYCRLTGMEQRLLLAATLSCVCLLYNIWWICVPAACGMEIILVSGNYAIMCVFVFESDIDMAALPTFYIIRIFDPQRSGRGGGGWYTYFNSGFGVIETGDGSRNGMRNGVCVCVNRTFSPPVGRTTYFTFFPARIIHSLIYKYDFEKPILFQHLRCE